MLTDIFLLPVFYFVPADVDRLIVQTDPAIVSISPVAEERNLLSLPELEFPVRVIARCRSNWKPDSISISIADTRVNFDREALPADAVIEVSIGVSSRQVAPVAVDGFCGAGNRQANQLLLPTALTAQVSLRCIRGDEQSIAFRARALDVLVNCETEPRDN